MQQKKQTKGMTGDGKLMMTKRSFPTCLLRAKNKKKSSNKKEPSVSQIQKKVKKNKKYTFHKKTSKILKTKKIPL